MAEDIEEFSFPVINDTPPHFIEFPPLWRCSSSSSSSTMKEDFSKLKARKSFSCIERGNKAAIEETEDDDECKKEEKMDMLWQDLNEQASHKTRGLKIEYSNTSPARKLGGFGCGHSLKLTRTGKKKPTVMVFVHLLKKLFLIQDLQVQTLKKQTKW